MLIFRTSIADWNPVPSGSMRPTIHEGDVVLVNRLAFDLKLPFTKHRLINFGDPRRGDIVTFDSPTDNVRMIKRIVALPGDVVQLKEGRLWINSIAAEYVEVRVLPDATGLGEVNPATIGTEVIYSHQRQVQSLAVRSPSRNFGPIQVPANHYFMLGDNRDNSADSRYIGFVPRENLIGRTRRLILSVDILDNWMPVWSRWGMKLQ